MQEYQLTLASQDNHTISGTAFCPDNPGAVLVIAHGMAEHAGRYTNFARWLAERGIATVTYNHRGHGPDCTEDQLGYYSDDNGWNKVTDDLHKVLLDTRKRLPDTPLILMGHSMGSFIAQSCAQQYGDCLDALILSATNRIHRSQLRTSRLLIAGILKLRGKHHRSPTIAKLTFGKFNRLFKPNRTECDWLSRDTAQVDNYLADPLCGFKCTTGLWRDFIEGMLTITPTQWRKDLPVHLFAGTKDPVGEMGEGIRRHHQNILKAGVHTATLRLFDDGRHEMLNEINADDVWCFVLALLNRYARSYENVSETDPLETS